MAKQPNLVTQRLKLLPISHRFAASLWPILSHPMVRQYNDIPEFVDKTDFREYLQTDIELWLKGLGGRWVIEYQQQIIGSCGFYPFDGKAGEMQLGFELAPEFWSQGMMYEACLALFQVKPHEFGFSLNNIYARCHENNRSCITLLSKLGFKQWLNSGSLLVFRR